MSWIRPGPTTIPAQACPAGLVIHVYAVPTKRLLAVSFVSSYAEALVDAQRAADAAYTAMRPNEEGVCLVAYDGDTGERMVWEQ